MIRHVATWKPVLIGLVSLTSLLYALPSLIGGVPSWWPGWLPSQVIHRGLDLQGGLHLLKRVETDKALEQTAENLADEIKGALRADRLRYRGIERVDMTTISLKLSEASDLVKIREILKTTVPNLVLTETSSQEWMLQIPPEEQRTIRRFAVDQSIQTIRSRIDQFGVSEPTIQRQGEERILIQLPGLKDPDRAKDIIGRTARLEFKMVDEKGDLAGALSGRVPPGDILLYGETLDRTTGKKTRQPYLLKKRTVLSGDLLTDARVNIDGQFNEPYVSIVFNRQGGRKFAQITGDHVKERMAIVLDNMVYSAPVIQEKIAGGRAQITGNFTPEEAHDLAIVLRAGALPAPIHTLEERTVGPTLGSDSVQQGLMSILIGGALVLAFMVLYYKGFGLLANIAVIVNIIILMAVLASMQATLTLPGIAGVVLLLGMSVDANVLIFERIREELKVGKTPRAAIDHGYSKAFYTIVDANLTTLITAVVLYQFGTGPVRGFAVTLSLGILASMFTAIFMTRVILTMFLGNRRLSALSL
ncbi:MAG: protein translocase subunit SecD [Magnetococcales bacterium]|nr:protein translocase subunit SecD [Magnetococcales bacterium]